MDETNIMQCHILTDVGVEVEDELGKKDGVFHLPSLRDGNFFQKINEKQAVADLCQAQRSLS